MTEMSVTKTLAILTGVGYFVAGRRTILGKLMDSLFYSDVNSAMVAAYLLYTFSEVESRFGSRKFLKFFLIQAGFSAAPFLRYSGVDWLVYSLFSVNMKLICRPRAHIFPSILLMLSLLSSKALAEALSQFYLVGTGLLTFTIISKVSMKWLDAPLRIFLRVLRPIFTVVPGLFSAATESSVTRNPPYLATESWRKQALMERIERTQMQRMTMGFQGAQNMAFPGAGARRRHQATAAPRPVQVDAAKLEILKSMGFAQTQSENALRQTNNDLEQATNALLAQ